MNLQSFLKFCTNFNLLIPRQCSSHDCKVMFQKTLKIGKENEQINQFIRYDKRIQYIAFKDILLPLLANQRRETIEELIQQILSQSPRAALLSSSPTQQLEEQQTSPTSSFGG
jgi:hypothetical protein